ncbi:hypothetical protein QFZ94_000841 [Paraburkholderia sp. JPY465]
MDDTDAIAHHFATNTKNCRQSLEYCPHGRIDRANFAIEITAIWHRRHSVCCSSRRRLTHKHWNYRKDTTHMVTTRPCTAACVIDGRLVTLTFYPDNGVLRIADPTGVCLRETRWHGSWRALLEVFRGYYDPAENNDTVRGVDDIVARLGERSADVSRELAFS